AALAELASDGLLDTVLRNRTVQQRIAGAVRFHLRIGKVEGAVAAVVNVGALLHVYRRGAGWEAAQHRQAHGQKNGFHDIS
nr:hypothetical protein [Tanacetum cinerariifolium]